LSLLYFLLHLLSLTHKSLHIYSGHLNLLKKY
jgi:hypothetical protein